MEARRYIDDIGAARVPVPPTSADGPTAPTAVISPIVRASGPSSRLSSRSLHPTNQGWDGQPDEHLSGALSFAALRAIATRLARLRPSVPPGRDDPSAPRSARLLTATHYDVWLVTWPDGSGLGSHDHGGVRSVLRVVAGDLIEIVADHVDEQRPRARILRQGDTVFAGPSFVHGVANRSGAEATTLHVCSPPLEEISFSELPMDGDLERLPAVSTPDAPGQPTRGDPDGTAPLRLPPLSLVVR